MNAQLNYAIYQNENAIPGTHDYSIIITVTNDESSTTNLRYFQIYIPMGDGDNDLTTVDDTSSIIGKAPEGWSMSPPPQYDITGKYFIITFSYGNHAGYPVIPSNTILNFTIDNITINNLPGIATCNLYEYTVSQNTGGEYDFSIEKVDSPISVSFYPSSSYVKPGEDFVICWCGPVGWVYSISYGGTTLPDTLDNESSQSVSIDFTTDFSMMLKQAGKEPIGPYSFTVRVIPAISFTGTVINENQLQLNWTITGATIAYGSWVGGNTIALTSTDNPITIAPYNDWTSTEYAIHAYGGDTDATSTCVIAPPEIKSFLGTLERDDFGYYIILSWDVSGAFYVTGSWASNTIQSQPQSHYAPFEPEYSITAYVLSDVSTTETIQTVSYVPATIIKDFTYNYSGNTIVLQWDATEIALSVNGSWQQEPLPTAGTATIYTPFSSSYTLTAYGLVAGQFSQRSLNPVNWQTDTSISIQPTYSNCIAIDNTTWLVGCGQPNYGAVVVSDGNIVSRIGNDSIAYAALLVTADGKTAIFYDANANFAVSYDIGTGQIKTCYLNLIGDFVVLAPDDSCLYTADINSITGCHLATTTHIDISMPGYQGTDVTCMSISPNSEYLLIGVAPDFENNGYLVPVNAPSKTRLQSIVLGNKNPVSIAFTPDSLYALVACTDNAVLVLDLSSLSIINIISIDGSPQSIATTPDGGYAFVLNASSNTVTVIDIATFTVVKTIPVSSLSQSLAISPDSRCVFVSSPYNIVVIDVEVLSVAQTLTVNCQNIPLAISPDSNSLGVADYSKIIIFRRE